MDSASRKRVLALAALLVVVGGSGFQLLPRNHSREVAEHFASALADPGGGLEFYFSPAAEIFLQGAAVSMSPAQFRDYLAVLRRGHQAFHAASRVYLTDAGAGWFLQIAHVNDGDYANTSQTPPELWLESTIDRDRITRLWIHFTREALRRQSQTADAYRNAAAARGTPVPEAWSDGTQAMLEAAETIDARIDNDVSANARRDLLLLTVTPLVPALVVVARSFHQQRPPRTARGEILAKLRDRYG